MPVLRSREIPSPSPPNPTSSKPKTLKLGFIAPSTPAKSVEPMLTLSPQETSLSPNSVGLGTDLGPTSRRRSLRLASKSISGEIVPNSSSSRRKRRRNVEVDEEIGYDKSQFQLKLIDEDKNVNDFGSLRLGLGLDGEYGSIRVSDSDEKRDFEKVNGFGSLGLGLGLDGEDIRVSDSDEKRDVEKVNGNGFGNLGLGLGLDGDGIRVSDSDEKRDFEKVNGFGTLGLGLDGEDGIRVSDSDEKRDFEKVNGFGSLGLGLDGEDGIRVSDSDEKRDFEKVSGFVSFRLGLGLDGEDGIRVSDSDEERDFEKVFEDKGFERSERETRKRGRRRSGFEGIEVKQENGFLSLRSGARISKRSVENVVVMEPEAEIKDVKGKGILIEEGSEEDEGASERKIDDDEVSSFNPRGNKSRSSRRLTREEKGKGKLIEFDVTLNTEDSEMLTLNPGLDYPNADFNPPVNAYENVKYGGSVDNGAADTTHVLENVALQGSKRVNDSSSNENAGQIKSMMGRFKDIARRNASKYAHFDAREEEENHVNSEAEVEEQTEPPAVNGEDWPGPFSTAMKIIRDRETNLGGEVHNLASGKGGMPLVMWTPRRERDHQWPKRAAPSLQDMCLTILAKNVDAITSLMYVPDVLRHKLTQMLCDSRRMNAHFLDLLLEGSPSEIRLPDCSWLEEDKFEKSFEGCDTNNTTVLQLDLCGHCLSDSSLLKALVPKGLPSLTMVSLRGACRISDVGLSALVSSAPTLRSMNLSQCSLLTDVGINSIADSLGSILRELYLDDCESLDAMQILPGLKRLKCLEVLSLRGIGSVSDKFIKQLINANGRNMKELVLANCVKLTDSSLKVIAEMCSQLCVLDLSHLTKLTDVGMVHLANGCRGIEDLKLCRSPFSDAAIAAFLEASGESLRELSLNNIAKVGQNTTISLSRRCKNLQSLDLSWCRNLTDEAMGLIADSCLSLRVLKLFGCTQVTRTFLEGHSNPNVQIIGLQLTPILDHIKRPDFQQGPLHYSAVPSF